MFSELRAPEIIEPSVVPEIFLTGMLPPIESGGIVKLVGYTEQQIGGETVRVVVLRVVWTAEALAACMVAMNAALKRPKLALVR